MSTDAKYDAGRSSVGLCSDCTHSRRVESERGSVFWLCQLSATDSRFPKYPRLPVLSCPGYAPGSVPKDDAPGG